MDLDFVGIRIPHLFGNIGKMDQHLSRSYHALRLATRFKQHGSGSALLKLKLSKVPD
ncbi:hypothetical protein [Chitinophaga agri]|uniref:Uncharacterized protein n=1 Tax=Chitinophaga agri TaxID=2703787 RepID=A0A6B9ZIT1_9BACT|nr:hypothetical protein [Chitinophaga agri]QHS61274.1 hypothetical protein GWR21_17215 [Chitinophaga agri]